MKRIFSLVAAALLIGTANCTLAQVSAAPTLINFQGRLANPSGNPVPNGTYSIRFSLWDDPSTGTEKWFQVISNVQVRNGTFAVLLNTNTAGLFNGNLWFEIKVGADTALTPRQQIVSVPFALKANSVADGSITNNSVANGTLTNSKFASGTFNTLAWLLGGNSGTNPASQFVGTTDNQPLVFRVNNRQAGRLEYAENISVSGFEYRSINLLGGSQINTISTGIVGATISGGGLDFFAGSDYPNRVLADFGTVGGGDGNIAAGLETTVGGGFGNIAQGDNAAITGGFGNFAGDFAAVIGGYANSATGPISTIGGGNINRAFGLASVVAGGENNEAAFEYGTVSGGQNNRAGNGFSTVSGGQGNLASGFVSTVSGGDYNIASGNRSIVVGGSSNTASGFTSLAAGFHAKAVHDGAFVWSDSVNADFASTAPNQFLIRAGGNVGINTNAPTQALDVNGNIRSRGGDFSLNGRGGGYGYSGGAGRALVDTGDGSSVGYGGLVINFFNDYGLVWVDSDLYVSGTVFQFSDARYKKQVEPLAQSLDAILKLTGVSYLWDAEAFPGKTVSAQRQLGFIAQEVEKILPELVTTDKRGYKSVNYIGVVPVLVEAVKLQQKQIETLQSVHSENAALKAQLAELTARLTQLEKAVQAR